MRALDLSILPVELNVRFALAAADRYAVLTRGEIVDEGSAGLTKEAHHDGRGA